MILYISVCSSKKETVWVIDEELKRNQFLAFTVVVFIYLKLLSGAV